MTKRVSQGTDVLIHHIRSRDIWHLETTFAYLTEDGWKIPAWLQLLKRH